MYPPVKISSRWDDKWLSYRDLYEFKMAAAVILNFLFILLVLSWADHACCTAAACTILSSLDDILPSYSGLSEFTRAAAAILVILFILPLLWIDSACGTASHVKFRHYRTIFGRDIVI